MKIFILLTILLTIFQLKASEENELHRKGQYRIDAPGIEADFFEEEIGKLDYFTPVPDKDGYITHQNEGAAASWEVYVPESYDPKKPAGILSYINAGDNGKLPKKWLALMSKHNLIWIGANKAGNFVAGNKKKPYYNYWRQVMSIKGVAMIKERYNIDNDRVFLSGMSGGGRVSSLLITARPDIYKGAIYLCGCNRWFSEIKPSVIKDASKNYYVHLTGTKDFNLNDTKGVYEYYKSNNFKNSKLMVIDGLKHTTPEAEDYDKALQYLDTPKKARMQESLKAALNLEKSKRYHDAIEGFAKAASYGSKEGQEKYNFYMSEIESLYKTAKEAEAHRDFVLCLNTYDDMVKKFGKELCQEAYEKSRTLKKDKQVILEIKAMAYFLKIEKAIRGGNTNDKVKAALQKVINTCPESYAAKRAREELKEITR